MPITVEMIDQYLDFLGTQVQVCYETRGPFNGTPIKRKSATPPDQAPMTWLQAGELCRAVWDQAEGLERLGNSRLLPLNDGHKRRIKALGHWVSWIIQRGREQPEFRSEEVRVRQGFQGTEEIIEKVPTDELGHWVGPEQNMWIPFPKPPTYPFQGPINEPVPPPPLRVIADIDEGMILQQEYTKAFLLTVVQCADVYYTKGLLWPLYLFMSEHRIGPLAGVVLTHIPYAGPILTVVLVGYAEVFRYRKCPGTNTWPTVRRS